MIAHFPRCFLFALVTLSLLSNVAAGDTPCLSPQSDRITITPDGNAVFTVRLRSLADCSPSPGRQVEIRFSPEAAALIAWPAGPEQPLTAVTDENGEAHFRIRGSGCVRGEDVSSGWVTQIRVDGNYLFGEPMVSSPDAVNSLGLLPAQIGGPVCENGETIVGLADAVFHTAPIKRGLVAPCSKFVGEPDDPVGLDDAVFLTPYVKFSVQGTCGP